MKSMQEVFNGNPCGFSTRMTDEQVRHGQHAINCHDELVNALSTLILVMSEAYSLSDKAIDAEVVAMAALSKARGEK